MARKTEVTNTWAVVQVLEVTDVLRGERVCITGHLSAPRKEIESIIKTAGGEVHSDVKYDTSILVSNGDFTAVSLAGGKKSSKLLRAEQNNRGLPSGRVRTKILSEADFVQMIVDNSHRVP